MPQAIISTKANMVVTTMRVLEGMVGRARTKTKTKTKRLVLADTVVRMKRKIRTRTLVLAGMVLEMTRRRRRRRRSLARVAMEMEKRKRRKKRKIKVAIVVMGRWARALRAELLARMNSRILMEDNGDESALAFVVVTHSFVGLAKAIPLIVSLAVNQAAPPCQFVFLLFRDRRIQQAMP
jgi:hypothetical protein